MSKAIVITGSTKGIGYGLAEEFLKRGHNVVVSGRNQERLDKAVSALAASHKNVAGCLCDVTKYDDNEKLFAFAKEKFGRVDIWINNAGVAHPMTNVWELPLEVIHDAVNANVYGSIYGSRVAIKGMLEQGGGWIYNLEGFGSSGRTMAGLSVYGMTKAAAAFFGKSLAKEVANTPVKVATIQPGMVITDMVTGQYKTTEELEKVKPIFNIIANRLSDVVPWIADQILANQKNGALLQFQPRLKLMLRFLTALFVKRNVFD
ncbi:MAG: SDR family oxidoreductase [Anaerolineales bacterium]|nr:MAG: SDR family oxidoreductase [Anaerolineales bacterium]